jgi:agmatinase
MLGSLELFLLYLASFAQAHGDHNSQQEPITGPHKSLWYNTLPGDGGTQVSKDIVVAKILQYTN